MLSELAMKIDVEKTSFEDAKTLIEEKIEDELCRVKDRIKTGGLKIEAGQVESGLKSAKDEVISNLKSKYVQKEIRDALIPIVEKFELKSVACVFSDISSVGLATYTDDEIGKISRVASSALLKSTLNEALESIQ